MSAPPPEPRRDGPELTPTEARGAVRTGRNIWILVISLVLVVVVMMGYWLLHASSFSKVNHPQSRDFSNRDISTYQEPSPGARSSPGGSSGEANTQ